MPNCPKCGQEVDPDQRLCAWCGEELKKPIGAKIPAGGAPAESPAKPKGPTSEDARTLAKRGDLTGAIRLFNQVLENNPHDQEALFGIGGIHFKKAEYKKAAESWLRLKVMNPAYPKIDSWIQQAQKHLTPSTQHLQVPPSGPGQAAPGASKAPSSPSVSPPKPAPVAPPPSREPSRTPSSLSDDFAEEDSWRSQAVRVDKIDEAALEKELPKPKPAAKDEIVGVGRDRNAIQSWVATLGWILVPLYAIAIWLIYFI
jgi:tetratricopeptide (TPR) repeat protein